MKTIKPQELTRQLKAHQLWIKTKGAIGVRADFSHTDLDRADLSESDLRYADFTCASLVDTSFTESDLRGCIFVGTTLKHAYTGGAMIDDKLLVLSEPNTRASMHKVKVYKGMIFDGYNGKFYEVTSDAVVNTDTNDIDVVLSFMLDKHIVKPITVYDRKDVVYIDEELMFRVGVLINDDDLLMNLGTFTWIDDIENIKTGNTGIVKAYDKTTVDMLMTLIKLVEFLNDDDVNDTRNEIPSIDVMYTVILDAAYELYKVLIERMLTV
jgi:hypothetical protein